jgi:hypothetical protein
VLSRERGLTGVGQMARAINPAAGNSRTMPEMRRRALHPLVSVNGVIGIPHVTLTL